MNMISNLHNLILYDVSNLHKKKYDKILFASICAVGLVIYILVQ
jgi:hypothetical protein